MCLQGQDVTMERIALETGIARTTLFRLFPSRRDLLFALNLSLAERCLAEAPEDAGVEETLRHLCQWYAAYHPVVKLLFEAGATLPPDAGGIRTVVRAALERDGQPVTLADVIMPVWHERVCHLAVEGQTLDYDRELAPLVRQVLARRPTVRAAVTSHNETKGEARRPPLL
jgi:AcrR family transcriptional regulator